MKISFVIAATATAVLSAASAHAAVQINSVYVRAGTTDGLGGILGNQLNWGSLSNQVATTTVTAPSGLNTWTSFGNSRAASGPGGWDGTAFTPGSFDFAAANAWQETNGRGVWSINEAGVSSTVDTTPHWVALENRVFTELDSASAQLFFDILANGSTGTFTFNLKQAATQNGAATLSGQTSGFLGTTNIFVGATSFDLTISQALGSDVRLQVAGGTFVPLNNNHIFGTFSIVAYGNGISVPAPGALALLGLAGLAGRRRR